MIAGERRRASSGVRRFYPLDRRRDRRPFAWLAALTALLLGVRAASMVVVYEPGYTDAYYFVGVAGRVARGEGLTADFVWNYLEAPQMAALPVASHRFWMPLATLLQAAGIVLGGPTLGDFRAAQLAIVAVAAFIPVVTYAAARSLGAGVVGALAAAAVAGLGGAMAPAWVSLDAFAPAAVLGTTFFLAFARAARGSVAFGALAGLLVGTLYLARAEAAIFGLALLWLAGRPRSARAGAAGAAVALVIGLGWLARGVALTLPADLVARATLLVRYEDFFALRPPTLDVFLSSPGAVLGAKLSALLANALTAVLTVLYVGPIVPLVAAARDRWQRAEVRAFVGLAIAVYLAQSLVFTLHSTHGSFPHSIAAFFPFAIALAAAGTEDLIRGTSPERQRTVWASAVAVFGVMSVFFLGEWDVEFNSAYRARLAVVPRLPPGPVIAADAAAWRWISGREAVLAPADGLAAATCASEIYLAPTLVLEPAHFSAYDGLYASAASGDYTLVGDHAGIRLYAVSPNTRCITASR